ncbi:peptidase C12, ubiquitin carboxyl-terminal hydrolase 1 [Dendrothele bispora CBS 962.96]|uniref:Ubiquitin carboxyl-terminal hydrolase n=1 Tax=Dendrothele bispora (strain CBS 962.96) TaxID=1314807 RepID=A0A4S8MNF0_DENBC|nr:peptidase C12, ubiquitin carboxyl-terminal hydrolase 1 [Dendrothele bispora CBS 962.96]
MTASRWIPLENNPEVLNSWAYKAGLVSSDSGFSDIYGFDDELLGMVPRPVKAVLLLFPISSAFEERRKEEDQKIIDEGSLNDKGVVLWIKQTISNACGTIGLLHALLNADVSLDPDSPLAKFAKECKDKTPEERAKFLETTPLFASIHAEAASTGQSVVPTDLDTDLHFCCFVEVSVDGTSHLVELDGRRAGPVDRGVCEDLLIDTIKFVKDTYVAKSASIHFSMTSLGPPEF